MPFILFNPLYTGFRVSLMGLMPTFREKPLSPIEPNNKIKTIGKPRLNTTVEGLRKIARKLAFVTANIALSWLYCFFILTYRKFRRQNYLIKSIIKEHHYRTVNVRFRTLFCAMFYGTP